VNAVGVTAGLEAEGAWRMTLSTPPRLSAMATRGTARAMRRIEYQSCVDQIVPSLSSTSPHPGPDVEFEG
jgi:hypothetical protein